MCLRSKRAGIQQLMSWWFPAVPPPPPPLLLLLLLWVYISFIVRLRGARKAAAALAGPALLLRRLQYQPSPAAIATMAATAMPTISPVLELLLLLLLDS